MSTTVADARRLSVGIGQLAVSKSASEVLVAYGLGSCIGVSIFDPAAKVGGMAHVLLPDSEGRAPDSKEPARYADCGLDTLVQRMQEAGALKARMVVKLAGGAAVLGSANAEKFKIGERNADAIKERLKRHGLRLAAVDAGGTRGRTFELHLATGRTYVRMAASTPVEL